MRGLYWVRYDLRIHDNRALNAFIEECSEGMVLWCPSKSSKRAGIKRKNFLQDSLFHFNTELRALNQHVIVKSQLIANELPEICRQYQIEKIFFTSSYSTEEKNDELFVRQFCKDSGIHCQAFDQETLIKEVDLPFQLENMPFIFSDFRKKVEANLVIHSSVPLTEKRHQSLSSPEDTFNHATPELLFHGGEKAALKRLSYYFWESRAIHTYKETRNGLLGENDSTRLSPWLSLGLLSPRMIIDQLKQFEADHNANESTYWLLFELLWRDYLKFFSRKYGKKSSLKKELKKENITRLSVTVHFLKSGVRAIPLSLSSMQICMSSILLGGCPIAAARMSQVTSFII